MAGQNPCYMFTYVICMPLHLARAHDGVQWHPKKASLVSTTNVGNILIWHCPTPERWGAFAGGFEEVDENVEYEEREDEFDIVSLDPMDMGTTVIEAHIHHRKMKARSLCVNRRPKMRRLTSTV